MKFIIIIHKTQISEALFWALSIALIGCRIWADHNHLLISSISFFIIPTFYQTVCGAFWDERTRIESTDFIESKILSDANAAPNACLWEVTVGSLNQHESDLNLAVIA